ncbi:MAG TPA: hypothetical protein VFG66_13875 [Gemmatimonadales bacterium]|nr:hypothetical protein [Gemmatimonadales bacterium]
MSMTPMPPGSGRIRGNAGTTLALLVTLAGCGDARGGEGTPPAAAAASSVSTAAAASSVRTAPAPADACGWLPAAEVASIVGPLDGKPVVVRSLEQTDPDPRGTACRYSLADKPRVGVGAVVLEVDLSGAVIRERVGDNMAESFRQTIQSDIAAAGGSAPAAKASTPPGWDRLGKIWTGFNAFSGRIGHVAVTVMSLTPGLPAERTAALATRVRDAIPDLPFSLPRDPDMERLLPSVRARLDAEPTGPDPCALLSPAQAEVVLGKLVVPPYRSAGSPLALRNGESCTYFTAGHHTFTVLPTWSGGKMIFKMTKGVGAAVNSVAPDDTAAAADTLEGPWEEAAASGSTGDMSFLKNDRILEITFVTSSTDRAGALRLARAAMEKL